MADPRMFDTPVAVGFEEALGKLAALVDGVPAATTPFAEKYGNPHLPGSAATLLEAAANDKQVRAEHGEKVVTLNLVHLIVELARRIEELEAAQKPKAKAGGAAKK